MTERCETGVARVPQAAGLLLALLASCAPAAAADAGRGVLVLAIDALRYDHLSVAGYDRPTTPTLDALAREGVLFSEAYASAPALLPSHAALLTGCEPVLARRVLSDEVHAAPEQQWHIPDAVPRLAVELLADGYRTAAFVDDPWLAPVYGFRPGFQHYEVSEKGAPEDGTPIPRFLSWLRSLDQDDRWFAYVHLHDLERSWYVHDPQWERYFEARPELADVPPVGSTASVFFAIPHDRWRGGSRSVGEYEAQYDGHVCKLDQSLERLLGSLRAAGRFEDTILNVVGTYGVQFGEAGLYLTSGGYSMADLHVPWIVRLPADLRPPAARGQRVDDLASLTDVAPTLLELCGIPVPSGVHGVSQARRLTSPDEAWTPREHAFASCGIQEGFVAIGADGHCLECLIPGRIGDAALRRAWFGEERVDTSGLRVRFYDRRADPFPPLDLPLPSPLPDEYGAFYERANAWLWGVTQARKVLQEVPLFHEPVDDSTVQELRELGYLGRDVSRGGG